MALITLDSIHKNYQMGDDVIKALNGINLTIMQGEFVSIIGPSGSGKSTLMNIIGLLDRPDAGNYRLSDENVENLSDTKLSFTRNKRIGFVFQNFNLLPRMNALENVATPMLYAKNHNKKLSNKEIEQMSIEALKKVQLQNRMQHLPNELSGGQRQRVAIARALVNNPQIILADEPTGALDSKTGEEILQLFMDLNNKHEVTIILVTHDMHVAQSAKRIITMKDGEIISDVIKEKKTLISGELYAVEGSYC